MAVENFNKYMQLAKILNNSWGTGSQLRSVSQSIKFTLRDEKMMKASFHMIVTMPNAPKTAHEFKLRYKNEAIEKIKNALVDLKERFENENDGKKIQFKMLENTVTEGVEYLTNSQYRPTLKAYFRLHCLISVD